MNHQINGVKHRVGSICFEATDQSMSPHQTAVDAKTNSDVASHVLPSTLIATSRSVITTLAPENDLPKEPLVANLQAAQIHPRADSLA
jgi:hypothetical protein